LCKRGLLFLGLTLSFWPLSCTDIPHFETKREIETYIGEKHATLPVTILQPTAFMDNLTDGSTFQGRVFNSVFTSNLKRPLQLIACSDIGEFAALSFDSPDKFIGKKIPLAGDELDPAGLNNAYKAAKGSNMPVAYGIFGKAVCLMVKEMGLMFTWFNQHGYTADIAKLKGMHPGLKDFTTWVKTEL
jgi:hypothetical protein